MNKLTRSNVKREQPSKGWEENELHPSERHHSERGGRRRPPRAWMAHTLNTTRRSLPVVMRQQKLLQQHPLMQQKWKSQCMAQSWDYLSSSTWSEESDSFCKSAIGICRGTQINWGTSMEYCGSIGPSSSLLLSSECHSWSKMILRFHMITAETQNSESTEPFPSVEEVWFASMLIHLIWLQ